MKIGLVRHFKVALPYPKKILLSKSEVLKWFESYETADVETIDVNLHGIEWHRCYTSPIPRALTTAGTIYKGETIQHDALKELDILHLLPDRFKLPLIVWAIIMQRKSLTTHADVNSFRERITAFVDHVLNKETENTLIVAHWFVMKELEKELLKSGFTGNKLKSPKNGLVYLFEKR